MLPERRLSSEIRYLHGHSKVLSVLKIWSPAGEPSHWSVVTQESYSSISGLIHDSFIIAWHWEGAGESRRELLKELCQRDVPLVDDLPLCLFASCLRWSSLRCSLHSPIMLSCLVTAREQLDNWRRNKISEAVNQAMLLFPSGVSSALFLGGEKFSLQLPFESQVSSTWCLHLLVHCMRNFLVWGLSLFIPSLGNGVVSSQLPGHLPIP